MKDKIVLREEGSPSTDIYSRPIENYIPQYDMLEKDYEQSAQLVDEVVLKKYLHKLTEFEIEPLDESLKQLSDIRLFKITEMVYQNDEYSTYKFASVFSAVQNLNCGVFIIVDSDGLKTNFYMGVRSLDDKRTTKSLKDTLKNALSGQFPGVKTEDLLDSDAEVILERFPSRNISIVSCVANNKDEDFKNNTTFIQGLEKLALAMQGQKYTAVLLGKSTSSEQLEEIRNAYESIYTDLSPFKNMQISYAKNTALNISKAFTKGKSTGSSSSLSTTSQTGSSISKGVSENKSNTKQDPDAALVKVGISAALMVASTATAPLTGGLSYAVAGAIDGAQMALNFYNPDSKTEGVSTSKTSTENHSISKGETNSKSQSITESESDTRGMTEGSTDSMQLSLDNKTLVNTLERIDLQLKRINEFENIGMWESAAYFLSDSQETTEMVAGTYKAIMKGKDSGVETSSINLWNHSRNDELPLIREYIMNFIHPVFKYKWQDTVMPITASSLVSSNELAIQMGLPRKSVPGFPVIEHADFGKEVVKYNSEFGNKTIHLGKVFNMGIETPIDVRLDCDSLTMHTFVTGSTGSGKSNTIYEILSQLKSRYRIPFMVIEPAKGEYKHVFGHYKDVSVYGTNPKKTELLKINPFSFPDDIHVLEHIDRLIEIFNVCWPMYAAMPAILKEAMEKAYVMTGWDLNSSENLTGDVYPSFEDLSIQVENIINESQYSAESKGNYIGALLTRVRSLTTGLNRMIFSKNELSNKELFDKNVIIDLSRIGSSETKSFIMGLLVMKLNEYRMTSGKINSPLSHITVLEEAHNLLKRTSTEQNSEGSNLLGKSVEMLANSIAEMRTYGEGFIIADQSPGLLDMSTIRNTNTKIILRLPDKSDRELVGFSAGLNEEQITELSKLERGVAAVYQNDWVEPVLVKVNKNNIKEIQYKFERKEKILNSNSLKNQLINLLIQGRVGEKLKYSIDELEKGLDQLSLTTSNYNVLDKIIIEYKENGRLNIWKDKNFNDLSVLITDIIDVREKVERASTTAKTLQELDQFLTQIVNQLDEDSSELKRLTMKHCLMKDMSLHTEEKNSREYIYKSWYQFIKERRML